MKLLYFGKFLTFLTSYLTLSTFSNAEFNFQHKRDKTLIMLMDTNLK